MQKRQRRSSMMLFRRARCDRNNKVAMVVVLSCLVLLVLRPGSIVTTTLAFVPQPKIANDGLPIGVGARRTTGYGGGLSTRRFMSIPTSLDTLTSGFASIFCLPFGVTVSSPSSSSSSSSLSDTSTTTTPSSTTTANNIRIVKLYDIENSPQCRLVRERITELDLVVETVVPAASNSFAVQQSDSILAQNGMVVPMLVVTSSTTGEMNVVSGVDDILTYLDDNMVPYSSGRGSSTNDGDVSASILQNVHVVGSYLAGWIRLGRGTKVASCVSSSLEKVNRPVTPLILYSYEGNQFCRLVREVLTELDITYELRSAGKESPRRAELAAINGGSSQCPYLIDPNTGMSMAESRDIIQYLYDNYALWTPPSEILEWLSDNVVSLVKPIYKILAPLQAGASTTTSSSSNDKNINDEYQRNLAAAITSIQNEVSSNTVVVYTYDLSPFSYETKALLDSLKVEYAEISLGKEWIPGLISPDGAIKRAALLEMTGQSSLPHIFIGGQPVGGLFSGQPGLVPLLKEGRLWDKLTQAKTSGSFQSVGVFE
jgi:glutaredoxin